MQWQLRLCEERPPAGATSWALWALWAPCVREEHSYGGGGKSPWALIEFLVSALILALKFS